MNALQASPDTALARGLRELVARLQERIEPDRHIQAYLGGGMAVHLYLGKRVTSDVDAEFSARVLIPQDLIVKVCLEDGSTVDLHFDTNYNSRFALMHGDYTADAVATEMGRDKVKLFVLSPVDLAVSKVARFMDVDREDIASLAAAGLFTVQEFQERCEAALAYYVGGNAVRANVRDAVEIVRCAQASGERDGDGAPEGWSCGRKG